MNLADYDRSLTIPDASHDPFTATDLASGPLGTGLYLAAHPDPPHPPLNWIKAATGRSVYAGAKAGLLTGAPAIAFTVATATGGRVPDRLHRAALGVIRTHLKAADRRLRTGRPARFESYDLFTGLTGLGAYLLHTDPVAAELAAILDHLALLADPARCNCDGLPLWWVDHAPNVTDPPLAGGHGNLGIAHGIAGPLALLALATIEQTTGPAHAEAIGHYLAIFDHWQQSTTTPWWPHWITLAELDANTSDQPAPGRPSWCYGTPGIARAQQLAGIALGDRDRALTAALALRSCLTDPDQLTHVTDASLCHGWAGIYQTAWRAHQDEPDVIDDHLLSHLADRIRPSGGSDLLEGQPGQALAALTSRHQPNPTWDLLLLLA
ncbi:lanthionine synthetase C family protein [Glycomyces salinus]|uniref:lanthionine synthetase C family protein n=1 Tax=Glycomyces salinus TaxID=980294 RepID=UPI0018ECFE5F|nr:lanthionine synthetase C family protein [Glycomyces salinus]